MGFINTIPRCYDKGLGGVEYALFAPWCDVSIYGPDASGYVALAAANGVTALADLFVKVKFAKETSGFAAPATGNAQTGTIFYAHTFNATIARNNVIVRNALKAMGQKEVVIVVKDANGSAWMLGDSKSGLDLTAADMASGAAVGDLSGTTMTFLGNCAEPPAIITDASLAALQ
jgi:hypothetical protein